MKRTVLQPLVGIILGSFTLLACEGDEGPTGPAGPQGDPGMAGPPGPQGPAGTANVLSGSVTLADDDWSSITIQLFLETAPGATTFGTYARFADIDVGAITGDVLASGAVLVYMQLREGGPFVPLPHRFRPVSSAVVWHFDANIREGRIRLLFSLENLDNPDAVVDPLITTQTTRVYRWVVIPPAAAAQINSLQVDDGPDAVLDALASRGFEVRRTH